MADESPYVVISADTHAGAPLEVYRRYLPQHLRGEFDAWLVEYRRRARVDLDAQPETQSDEALLPSFEAPNNWDTKQRQADMEGEGIVAEVAFPNTVLPFFWSPPLSSRPPSRAEFPLRLEGVRAYNAWLSEWCAETPVQRAGVGLILLNDLKEAVTDVRWIAAHGLRGGILLPEIPPDNGDMPPLYAKDYDILWSTCQELGVVINQHGGRHGCPDYGPYPASLPIRLLETRFFATRGFSHLVLSGMFERFPALRYVITETGCAWLPGMVKQLDNVWERARSSVGEFRKSVGSLSREPPSVSVAKNCYLGASSMTRREFSMRGEIGVHKLLWGSDYPHTEGTFPNTRQRLRDVLHDAEAGEVRQVLGANAAGVYSFDLDRLGGMAARLGPSLSDLRSSGSPGHASSAPP